MPVKVCRRSLEREQRIRAVAVKEVSLKDFDTFAPARGPLTGIAARLGSLMTDAS
jgi:hypothetical protein